MREHREFLREDEVITSEQVQLITGLDLDGATRECNHLLGVLNNGSNEILLDDFCLLNELNPEEVFYCLNPPQEKWVVELEDEYQEELDRFFKKNYKK